MLAKYYFRPRTAGWQPFLGTGWAFRTVGVRNDGSETVVDRNGALQSYSFTNHYRTPLDAGAVFAAGARLHKGRVALLPEFRYARWGSTNNITRRNEVSFLFGLSF